MFKFRGVKIRQQMPRFLANKIKVSGDKVLGFSKNILRIPEDFNRDLKEQRIVGKNFLAVMRLFYYFLFLAAIFLHGFQKQSPRHTLHKTFLHQHGYFYFFPYYSRQLKQHSKHSHGL